MKFPTWKEASAILTAHHITSILLTASFYVSRTVPPICSYLYPNRPCVIDGREYEIMLFCIVVVSIKNRRATTWMNYLSNFFLFSRIANLIMFYRADPKCAMVFVLLMILHMVLFPEPVYAGPENIVYFRGPSLKEEIDRDKKITWVVEFYASWSPNTAPVAPVFAALSVKYGLANLKFAKLDVGRYPKEAERFRVNVHPTSRQLPTVSLFRGGKEVIRRPIIDNKSRAIAYVFNEENITLDFDLNNIHADCLKNLPKSKKEKPVDEKKED